MAYLEGGGRKMWIICTLYNTIVLHFRAYTFDFPFVKRVRTPLCTGVPIYTYTTELSLSMKGQSNCFTDSGTQFLLLAPLTGLWSFNTTPKLCCIAAIYPTAVRHRNTIAALHQTARKLCCYCIAVLHQS